MGTELCISDACTSKYGYVCEKSVWKVICTQEKVFWNTCSYKIYFSSWNLLKILWFTINNIFVELFLKSILFRNDKQMFKFYYRSKRKNIIFNLYQYSVSISTSTCRAPFLFKLHDSE